MSVKLIEDTKLTAIGNAIRAKDGSSALIDIDDMPQAIANIPSGGGGGGFDWSQVKGDSSNGSLIFANSSLQAADFTGCDTSNFVSVARMFDHCSNLRSINWAGIDTSKVATWNYFIIYCTSLTSLDLSKLSFNAATSMNYMFRNNTNLTSINLSSIKTSSVTNMSGMFTSCSKLTDIIWSQSSTMQKLASTPAACGITASMKFYVPDALLNEYKSSASWSDIESQIYSINDLPAEVAALYAGHY